MPKKIHPLSAMEVSRFTEPGLYAVGGVAGLSLQVSTGRSRSWICRIVVGKKRRYIGLGGYPDVSLSQVREGLIAAQSARLTFAEAARRKHDAISREFRNPNHSREWISSLERYAFDVFGDMNVNEIGLPQVVI